MRRTILLLLIPVAIASGQDTKSWQKEQREITRDAKKFWSDFKGRFTDALKDFRAPVDSARSEPPKSKPEAVYDYAGIDRLYKQARSFGELRGEADRKLDGTDPKAAAALLKVLLDDSKRADKLELELADANPDFGRYIFNQENGCRVEALNARRAGSSSALGKAPLAYLTTEAWKKCVRGDGKKSFRRRVALLDTLGARGDADAQPFLVERLTDKSVAIRIAATEALVATKKGHRAALTPTLADPNGPVRRALLLAILPAPDAGWFAPVLAHATKAHGFERELCVRVLAKISNQTFGYDFAAWNKWYEVYEDEIKGGKFDIKTVEVAKATAAPDPDAFSFYGLAIPAIGAVFVLDASQHIAMPADVDVQRTQWRDEWRGTRRQWETENEAHQTTLVREMARAFRSFPDGFRWAAITLFGRFTTKAVGDKRLLSNANKDLTALRKLISQAPEKGWCSPLQGMLVATAIGGDEIDTIVLWHTGDPAGGRYMSAAPAAAAWNRANRFRRLQVIAIRISNRKDPAEAFMKEIATTSGGQYVWARKPPAH